MPTFALAVWVLSIGLGSHALFAGEKRSERATESFRIPVRVTDGGGIAFDALGLARIRAESLLAKAGIQIVWEANKQRVLAGSGTIEMSVISHAPGDVGEEALAIAHAYEGVHIQIFYDRLQQLASRRMLPHVLAHVMVHEIVHLLMECDWHSEVGVMKAHWTKPDYDQMDGGGLAFTSDDVQLIQAGARRRQSRLSAAGNSALNKAVR